MKKLVHNMSAKNSVSDKIPSEPPSLNTSFRPNKQISYSKSPVNKSPVNKASHYQHNFPSQISTINKNSLNNSHIEMNKSPAVVR